MYGVQYFGTSTRTPTEMSEGTNASITPLRAMLNVRGTVYSKTKEAFDASMKEWLTKVQPAKTALYLQV